LKSEVTRLNYLDLKEKYNHDIVNLNSISLTHLVGGFKIMCNSTLMKFFVINYYKSQKNGT